MSDAKPVEAVQGGEDEFWMQFLRPILFIGIGLGALTALLGLLSLSQLNEYILAAKRAGRPWLTGQVFFGYAIGVGVPLCLVIGALRTLMRRSNARLILLIYAWISLGLSAYSVAMALWNLRHVVLRQQMFLSLASIIQNQAWQAAFPAILLILLTRKPIADVFRRRDVAFEVMPPPPPTE